MPGEINIYCDESCHLENDGQPLMVLGAIWCNKDISRVINEQIRNIKADFGLNKKMEIKWIKVSPAKQDFYIALIRFFFSQPSLHYRGLVAIQKEALRHDEFMQDHDIWYYKMYFQMLNIIIEPENRYNIYLDIKDTHGAKKAIKLRDVLCNNIYDFSRVIVRKIQPVQSREIEIIQLTDLITGALGYLHRNLESNAGKLAIVEELKRLSHYSLKRTTLVREPKFNLLIWTPRLPESDQ